MMELNLTNHHVLKDHVEHANRVVMNLVRLTNGKQLGLIIELHEKNQDNVKKFNLILTKINSVYENILGIPLILVRMEEPGIYHLYPSKKEQDRMFKAYFSLTVAWVVSGAWWNQVIDCVNEELQERNTREQDLKFFESW